VRDLPGLDSQRKYTHRVRRSGRGATVSRRAFVLSFVGGRLGKYSAGILGTKSHVRTMCFPLPELYAAIMFAVHPSE
jgi:hypothetical protein